MTAPMPELDRVSMHFPVTGGGLPGGTVGTVEAVDKVSVTLVQGQTLALVGESGCGKTTTARPILELLERTDGRALVDGLDVARLQAPSLRRFRTEVQAVFRNPWASLNPRMRGRATVAEPLDVNERLTGGAFETQAQEAFALLATPSRRHAAATSERRWHSLPFRSPPEPSGMTANPDAEAMPARRRVRIVERVRIAGAASIRELVAASGASAATIRRDLEQLEAEGYLERTHGGAVLPTALHATFEPEAAMSALLHVGAKRAIGEAAAGLLRGRESVLFDSSSTVLTVDLAFVGAHAVGPAGSSDTSLEVAATKRAIVGAARRIVLLADATKFTDAAFARIVGLEAVHRVIVDDAIAADARSMLDERGIDVTVVSPKR